jgi:ABC-type polysaccharide/polyol phosphate export permease
MRNFLAQVYTTYTGLFGWLNWFSYISTVIFRPVVLVIIYSVLGRFAGSPEIIRSYAIGIAAYTMAVIILPGIAQCYTYDRAGGTLSFVFASPVNRIENYLARAVLHYPNGLLSFMATLVTAWIMIDLDFSAVNWGGFITGTLVIALSITALGEFLGTFAIVFRDWSNIQTVFVGLILILSGVIIPLDVFPAALQEIAKLLPVTNGLVTLKSTFIGGSLADTSGYIIREGLTGLVYLVIGYISFYTFEIVAKRRGTLEQETF